MRAGARKQAHVPVGAVVLEPKGTAPGFLVGHVAGGRRAARPAARAAADVGRRGATSSRWRGCCGRAGTLERRILRFFPLSEPQIAATLRELDADSLPFEVTTCLRRGELEVATVYRPAEADAYASFEAEIRERHGDVLFSDDDATIDEVIARALSGLTVATAESCTGGLMAGRLTDLAGSSAYVLGGVVVYSNEAKTEFADVDPALIAAHGAVSPEVARALAAGARSRFGADLGHRDHRDRRAGRRDSGEAGGDRVPLCVVCVGCGGADGPACRARVPTCGIARRRWRSTCCVRLLAQRG